MNLRNITYNIIYDVKHNKKYSNILINEVFARSNLKDEEKNFITYLSYGVLGNIYFLDYFIKKYSDIAFSKISNKAKIILEMSFFELIFMNSSQNYATVNESVALCKKVDFRAKNFVNAVLRKISSSNPSNLRNYEFDDIKDKSERLSVKFSISKYISDRLIENYGFDFAYELMDFMSKTPEIFIRGNLIKTDFNTLKSLLDENKLNYEIIDEKNMIFSLKNLKNIANLNIYKDGLISIQDYSSMLCVIASGVTENQTVLDICAAPGGKSIFMSQLMKNKGSILSMDISQNKLNLLSQQCKRLGIDIITTKVNDATIYDESYKEKFDVVLADVPCSGIGILRRKPEIRYKNTDEIESLPEIQKTILKNSSKYVKESGKLIYSTCTLGKEENQNITEDFIKNNPDFKISYQKEYYPNIDNTDGFYVCVMDRNTGNKK
ncbi:16S rRNA (cytosine967-C5)-methyltransferase [[Eubacterium] yurii]|nr:16S rRNA (cytosine967-C5)-methyltransferase [[Eubacterium] yurii]